MRTLLHRTTLKSALLLSGFFAAATAAQAQAMVSAQRGAEIAPFVQTTLINPDWGQTNNLGYTAGIDYTRFIRSIVQPSLEFRMTSANGTSVNERTYAGGLKLQTTVHNTRPYLVLLVGYGDVTFTYPGHVFPGDNSIIYTIGGGADVNVTSRWKLRVDVTQQHWNLDPNTLTPITAGVGVSYSLPFHTGQVR
jgi:hypothetical protein